MNSPLRDWLALQGTMIGGCEAAYLVLGTSLHAPGAIREHWPPRTAPSPKLTATLQAALARGMLCIQERGGEGEPRNSLTHIALPVRRGERVCGAVGVSVYVALPGESKAVSDHLKTGITLLEGMLESRDEFERMKEMLALATTLLDHESLAPAAFELAAEIARRFGCERVALGMRRGRKVEIVALSNTIRFSKRSDEIRNLCAAMEEALDQDAFIEVPAPNDGAVLVSEDHENLLQGSSTRSACTLPLASRGQLRGAITLEWEGPRALDEEVRSRIHQLGLLGGPLLELLVRADAGAFERIRARFRQRSERTFGSVRLGEWAVLAVAALVLIAAFVPAPYRVSARAHLEGRVQRALVAAVSGYLSEAHARAGDLVREGDVLARLDDRDLRLEARKWKSQRAQLEGEYREALALQDRTQISILRAQIDQATAQLDLAVEALARTEVIAPFDGIVLEGDLDRSLGSPVERGSVLFEIAPLDGYRIIVEVDGRDIADIDVAQAGRLTLSALPDEPVSLIVERITPISTTRDGRNYFRVEAIVEEPIDALRPGMEGVAKIEVGERRLLWIWTHTLLDWLRLALWSFLP